MRFAVVARQLPDRHGTAAGQALYAWCEGAIADGHDVAVWSWGPDEPRRQLPAWCTWEPLPAESGARTRARALVRPRSDVRRARWRAPADAIAVADDVPSFAAVADHPRSVVTLHYRTSIDAAALGRRSLRDVQDRRAERGAAADAWLTLAYSARAASPARGAGRIVPIAYDVPAEAMPFVEEPVVALIADWRWPANQVARRALLRAWPEVRTGVAGARLLLAGRGGGPPNTGAGNGVEDLGEVEHSEDVLARAALVAFPCPDTSGPKVKVLEALAHGVAVVTTPAGVEGLSVGGAVDGLVVDARGFADRVVALLNDPGRRAELATGARAAVAAAHAPRVAARARAQALTWALNRDDEASPTRSR